MSGPRYTHSGFFVLRTPLLPYGDGERADTDEGRRMHPELWALLDRPAVREALFVASPGLYDALESWERDGRQPNPKLEGALRRYCIRMSQRATPFGLFAGSSVGRIGDETQLTLPSAAKVTRHSRLDRDYLDGLVRAVVGDPVLREHLRFTANPSLHRNSTGRLCYTETLVQDFVSSHHLVDLDASEHLDAILNRASEPATPGELVDLIVSDEISRDEAVSYIDQLIDWQVLVCELEPPVTGQEPLDFLLDGLVGNPAATPVRECLARVRQELASLDADGVGNDPQRYKDIATRLEALSAPMDPARLFHVDLIKPAPHLVLAEGLAETLSTAVEMLHRISPPAQSELRQLRERLFDRFNHREVPLVDALDADAGVDFAEGGLESDSAPLLAGLEFPSGSHEQAGPPWEARDRFLLTKLLDATARGAHTLTLTDEDIAGLENNERSPLPDAVAVMAVIGRTSGAGEGPSDTRLLVPFAAGPSGARMLGRFTHGDPDLLRYVQAHLRAEEALEPECIFAEIAHLPQGRRGNILCRPLLRSHEIPYLGRSGAPAALQIPVSDLLVSVQASGGEDAGEIVLRARSLNRRVLPRLTTAHNFGRRATPLYRFLALLQQQNQIGYVGWSWGVLADAPFLPRVEYDNLVLSLAQWRLTQADLSLLGGGVDDRLRAMQALREARRIPSCAAFVDGDNVLSLDLTDPLDVESLLKLVKDRDTAVLQELWPDPDDLVVRGPEGAYVHELLLPLVRSACERPPRTEVPRDTGGTVRYFAPGSAWLSAKLYVGSIATDRVLTEVVAPLVEELVDAGLTDRWFFLRFADPELHVRVRFHCADPEARSQLQHAVQARLGMLVRDERAWKLVLDTYEREIERYGGPEGVELAERIFHVDSEAVLNLLSMFEDDDRGAEERWQMALAGADRLLGALGLDEASAFQAVTVLRSNFVRRLGVDSNLEHQLGRKFRDQRRLIESLLGPDDAAPENLQPGIHVLAERTGRLQPLRATLDRLEERGALTTTRIELAGSYLHMHLNRLVRSAHWPHELVIYDFLTRVHRSRAARAASAT